MKKFLYLAAIQAIAFVVALEFGLNWLFIGIGLFMIGEYCYFTVYEHNMTLLYLDKQKAKSRKMLLIHAGFCVVTLVLAALFGVLGGYDLWEEIQQGNSYEYTAVHQNGAVWWVLLLFLAVRSAVQILIEKAIKANSELAKRRELS